MGWRVAKSLITLQQQIWSVHPGTTVWTIGDQSHQQGASDHNPNGRGVVCAIDVLGNAGLDLGAFAERIRTSGHPALKYVIFDRRIASKGGPWRPYHGDNPHETHVHVSVGVGPDGQSTGPYDSTTPWNLEDDVSADDIWNGITIPKIDEESGTSSRMRPASYLAWIHEYAKQGLAQHRELMDRQTILAESVAELSRMVGALADGLGVPVDAADTPPSGKS